MERLSTGGTRHVAEFHRAESAKMDGTERMAKLRARRSLLPDAHDAARQKDADQAGQRGALQMQSLLSRWKECRRQ